MRRCCPTDGMFHRAHSLRENWFLYLLLLVYVVLISVVISHHEPWADEAQAWLLARDSGPLELLFKNLHYEGHPGLWYLVLFLPSKLLPYGSINVLSGLIATVGVYLFLRYSPFPKPIKLLFPFSYFIFYQYSIVARSYVLLPPLFFLLAIVYKDKTVKIYRFTAFACLIAYTSIYTMLFAIMLMLIHLIDLIRVRSELDRKTITRQIKAYAAFAIVIALIVIQLWQPDDSSFATSYNFSVRRFFRMGSTALNDSTTEIHYISALIMIVSLIWFWQRKALSLYLLPTLAILALFSIKYYNIWHQGILFLVWVFAMWISFEEHRNSVDAVRLHRLQNITMKLALVSFSLVMGIHIYWSFAVSSADLRGDYSVSKAVANYIKDNRLEDKKIYATGFWSTTILPYFDENIFDNHNDGKKPAFWLWAKDNGRMENFNQILQDQPDMIIMHSAPSRNVRGYDSIKIFRGSLYWKNRVAGHSDFSLFRRRSLVIDAPLSVTVEPGGWFTAPVSMRDFTGTVEKPVLRWRLDGLDAAGRWRQSLYEGKLPITIRPSVAEPLGEVTVKLPNEHIVGVLTVWIEDANGEKIDENYVDLDITSGATPLHKLVVVPTGEDEGQNWRYTTDQPAAGWEKPLFDDGTWLKGMSPFAPDARTRWDTSDIWLRRRFTLDKPVMGAIIRVRHDEDAAVYFNGKFVYERLGYTGSYHDVKLNPAVIPNLTQGENLIAVHCQQTTGGQWIDVGLTVLFENGKSR